MSDVGVGFDDVIDEMERRGLSLAEFARELDVAEEWVEYWVTMAALRRRARECCGQPL